MKFHMNNVRISFPDIAAPIDYKGDGRFFYKCHFLLPNGSKIEKEFKEAVLKECQLKWGDKASGVYKTLVNKGKKNSFGDGSLMMNDAGDVYNGYEGNTFIKAKTKLKPQVIKSNAKKAEDFEFEKEAERFYGGCYVNATISIATGENEYGKNIYINLLGIQFAKDGEPLGGGVEDVSNEFAPIENNLTTDDWDDIEL